MTPKETKKREGERENCNTYSTLVLYILPPLKNMHRFSQRFCLCITCTTTLALCTLYGLLSLTLAPLPLAP